MREVLSQNVSAEGWLHCWACTCLEEMADYGIVFRVVDDTIIVEDPDFSHETDYSSAPLDEGPALLAPYVSMIAADWLLGTPTEMLHVLNRLADDGLFSTTRTPIHRVYGTQDWIRPYIREPRLMATRIAFGTLVARIFDMILRDHRAAPVVFDDDFEYSAGSGKDASVQVMSHAQSLPSLAVVSVPVAV